jgi:hypothetical protein
MKTAEASTAWIWVEEAIPTLEETLVEIKLTLVYELLDATILQTSAAEQVTQKANQKYPNYLWQAVPCQRTGEFVVQGDLRALTLHDYPTKST